MAWTTKYPICVSDASGDTYFTALAWEPIDATIQRAYGCDSVSNIIICEANFEIAPWLAVGDAFTLSGANRTTAPILRIRAVRSTRTLLSAESRFWHSVNQALVLRWGSSSLAAALTLNARASAYCCATQGRPLAHIDWDKPGSKIPIRVLIRMEIARRVGIVYDDATSIDNRDNIMMPQRPIRQESGIEGVTDVSLLDTLRVHVGEVALNTCKFFVFGVELPRSALTASTLCVWSQLRGPDGWLTLVATT